MTIEVKKNTVKRDALADIERAIQAAWAAEKPFEADPPAAGSEEYKKKEKYMVNFPFPYMNGRLHLGHSFSFSKAEFAAGFERMKGKRVLFPFAFHCTGMPIKAASDKLRTEIQQFGNPPEFPVNQPDVVAAKHSKVAAKAGNENRQFKIMESLGIPTEDIHLFQDPHHWLSFFPPYCMQDLKALGSKIDWRRSFITTDANPYFDAFVCWQFRKLKQRGCIDFGKRYTIYSIKDGQPCMDHDRASGEGVEVQEYLGVFFDVVQCSGPLCELLPSSDLRVSVLTATLRQETLFGVTNAWVGPELNYGVYQISENHVTICCPRAARNLSMQGYPDIKELGVLKGTDLIGLPLRPPRFEGYEHPYKVIYMLPMLNLLETKGTAVVSSVPSDSPDDYRSLKDLQEKPALRAKYNLTDEMVLPFLPIGVIRTEGYDTLLLAEELCQKLNIKSQNDKEQLAKAKDLAYKDGFYHGTMMVGKYQGMTVVDAKPLTKVELLESGDAIAYAEPNGRVISRSGDECVVALVDQWYLKYGDQDWKRRVKEAIKGLNFYNDETSHQMDFVLDWLRDWACARSFGLGSKLPWDPVFLIESLSDSTIYMAYYTIAHYLHEGSFDGSSSPFGIKPEDLTDEVFDYIFLPDVVDLPAGSAINHDLLQKMKAEFMYFYPFDLRVSGKDLLFNHLAFLLFNHEAVFGADYVPHGIRINGHLLLNSEKMSKSTGNFMTLSDAIEKYTADGVRFALADAGDTLDDANFLEETADHAILRLYALLEFVEEVKSLDDTDAGFDFPEKLLEAKMAIAIEHAHAAYEAMHYREALKVSFYELINAKDRYMQLVQKPNKALLLRFVEVLVLLMSPLTPHFCEHVWRNVLSKQGSVVNQKFPSSKELLINKEVLQMDDYLKDTNHSLITGFIAACKPKKNSTTATVLNGVQVYIAKDLPQWQTGVISLLKTHYNEATKSFAIDDASLAKAAMALPACQAADVKKKVMPFLADVRKNVIAKGASGFIRTLGFDEINFLREQKGHLDQESFVKFEILDNSDAKVLDAAKAGQALPGVPSFYFYKTE